MNISEPFIRRPVMTSLVMISIMVFGILAFKALPVSDLPNVDFPTIQVQVSNPGSNPTTMANTCATPLEREFMTIDGISSITSNSVTGSTNIVIQFTLDKSMDTASVDVQAAINRAEPNLPNDLPYNPTYRKVNPSTTPILYYSITSPTMTLSELYDYGNTYLGQRISMIDGVSQVITYGAPFAARIQIDPSQAAAMNLGMGEIVNQIKQGNVDIPTGTLFGPKTEFTIDIDGQLVKGPQYQELVVKNKDGSLVKISQIGKAFNSLQKDKYSLRYLSKIKDQPTVVIAILRLPGANTVKVINSINQLIPNIMKELPPSLELHTVFDQSSTIMDSVHDVETTLIIAFFLVVFIIFLALGKVLNTVIPSLSLPMSIFGTFSIMLLLGYSVDILSLLALTLSIGFLVDDAIVVLENNVRHVQMGKKPFEASIEGSREIGMTIVSMTLCLVSVFIPMLFMGGVVGRLFREFAVTIVIAVIFSGLISLSLTALLSSRFIPEYSKEAKKGRFEKVADFINDNMRSFYGMCLNWVLNHKLIMLSVGVASIVGSLYLFISLPKDFLPDEDASFLRGYTHARDGTSPFYMTTYHKELSEIILNDDAVDYLVSAAAFNTDNEGLLFVKLKPYKERGPIQNVINRLMKETFEVPGVSTYLSTLPLINLQVGTEAKALYEYSLTSIDQDLLNKYNSKLVDRIKTISGITQVSSDLEIHQPQLEIKINRDRASDLNISAFDIESLFKFAYSDNKISTIHGSINQYDVIIETLPKYYRDPTVMSKLYVQSPKTGNLIPLTEIVEFNESPGPLSVNHLNGIPSATISYNLDGIPLGPAVEKINQAAKEVLPANITGSVLGTADVFKSSFANLTFLFIITFFVIYVILGILYESFIHPITVMSTLPPAIMGGLLSLFIFRENLSLYSFVGIIMLIGIVMKNGIMMVDFANDKIREEKKTARDAIYEAALIRIRPIMMTSFAAFMGALPIAIGTGSSASSGIRPLGIAVTGGLIFSQILTLLLTPVIYYYMERLQEIIKEKYNKKHPSKV